MQIPVTFLAPVALLSLHAGTEVPAQRALDPKAEEAVRITRIMVEDVLKAEKAVIVKFKALPDSDDIRILFGKNMYGWSVSDKCLSTRQEDFQTALSTYQKDFKDAALVDELRLFAKKIARESLDQIAVSEKRITRLQKELREGKVLDKDGKLVDITEYQKKISEGLLKVLPLEIEYQTEAKRIATAYGAGLAKLMD